jgi:hypothetical protein
VYPVDRKPIRNIEGTNMKILSIERQTLSRFYVWVEDGALYRKLIIEDDKPPEELVSVPTSKYKDYEHFVGVMGKFNPYTIFTEKPVDLPSLDFDVIKDMKFDWE